MNDPAYFKIPLEISDEEKKAFSVYKKQLKIGKPLWYNFKDTPKVIEKIKKASL